MNGREVLIGVTGGVAAFKTAALVSQLVQAGVGVTVAMTSAAREFVGPATFSALTGRHVSVDVFDKNHPLGAHIALAQRADVFCIAPATANFLAKAASGLADDLVSTLYLSFTGPTLIAPAMNDQMWSKNAVQRNIQQLSQDGAQIVAPESGWLSCRVQGVGRMADPETIFAAVQRSIENLAAERPEQS